MQAYSSGLRGQSAKLLFVGSNPTACSRNKMSWNYRILKHVDKPPKSLEKNYPNGVVWYGMHSVYYDENKKSNGCSGTISQLIGETPDELRKDMKRMLRAFKEPILAHKMFLDQEKKKNETSKSGNRSDAKSNKSKRA